jgi:isopentenyl phosphate kinase
MTSNIVIVKLGGAAITNKKITCQLALQKDLDALMDQVAIAYQELKKMGHQLILVHGAGSFGHPQAVKYQLKPGWSHITNGLPSPEYLKGYSHIRNCLQQLNSTLINQLESRNVPVLAMSPIDYIQTRDCENTPSEQFQGMAERVNQYLALGFVPVLHGDAVLDYVRGCTILSGDIIMFQLTKLIPTVTRCIFITDVNGIYQKDPKQLEPGEKNTLVKLVLVQEGQNDMVVQSVMNVADVTGGMQGKINWAKKIVSIPDRHVDVAICRSGSEEALSLMTIQSSDYQEMTLFTKQTY